MRPIDADELVKDIDELSKDAGFYRPIYEGFKNCVNSKQTIDAVPVVRCKKCVHYEMGVCLKIYDDGAASRYAWQERKPDDFCSYGERKEGAGEE